MANQTDWNAFRVWSISPATFAKRALIHTELLIGALRLSRARGKVLDVGTGSGAQAALLSRFRDVVAIDADERILEFARLNAGRYGKRVQIQKADAFALPFEDGAFDVAVSQGLMEHFSDERIGQMIREQMRVARAVLFSVPSDRYPRQDVGDERLMAPARWQEILGEQLSETPYRVHARYIRFDPESWLYTIRAGRPRSGYSVLVQITR